MESLYDSFSGGSLDSAKWAATINGAGTAAVADGSLHLTSPSASAGSNTWAGIWSSSPHDLTGSYAYVETVDPGTAGDAGTEGQLRFALLTAQLYGMTTSPPCNFRWIPGRHRRRPLRRRTEYAGLKPSGGLRWVRPGH